MKKLFLISGLALTALHVQSAFAAITMEAEQMTRSNYGLEGSKIRLTRTTGSASQTFRGAAGKYNMRVTVVAESDGRPVLKVYRGSTLLRTYTYPTGNNQLVSFNVDNVSLSPGQVIRLAGQWVGGAPARIDKLVLTAVTASSPIPVPPPSCTTTCTPTPAPTPVSAYPTQGSTGGLPVIPGASGFGINTRAGRGGTAYKVTNLNASGNGSLKACIDASGPRVCVFETSGTIRLSSDLAIRNPYITIAGQTAPSPGILVRGAAIKVSSHDVLVQHLRIRPGDGSSGPSPDNRDAIKIEANGANVYNVVIDHVSASWSTDELLSTWGSSAKIYDVTIRNSIFSEPLNNSIHPKGSHPAGVLIGLRSNRVSVVNNLFAHIGWRNPLIRDNSTEVMVINNLVYSTRGAQDDQIDFGTRGSEDLAMRASVVGNKYVAAPGQAARPTIYVNPNAASSFRLYQTDNAGPLQSANPWSLVAGRSASSISAQTPPIWAPGMVAMPVSQVENYVLTSAGARPADRDAVDNRVVAQVRGRSGRLVDSPSQVGGYPNLAVNVRPLTLPANPNLPTSSGYTNLEIWLQNLARAVEAH